ncbi:MAG: Gfo/Idh/MocA family protein [Planctomycetota bacterium]|jgi:predicted dehydrogenase
MSDQLTRRDILCRTALAGVGFWAAAGSQATAQSKSPNEKLNVAGIGVGGRGAADVGGVAGENLVALCDVDEKRAGGTFERFPKAKRFKDFRVMFDKMHAQIDAVVIGTPDHTHAPAGVTAMKLGKHCYCEKPLTHSVYEARMMAETAKEHKLVTQMGTQIHAGANYRRAVELIQSGAVGPVREVHVWLGANFSGPAEPARAFRASRSVLAGRFPAF